MREEKYPKRKKIRLQGFDYSGANSYLVTICTYHHKSILARVIPGDDFNLAWCELTPIGEIVEQELLALEQRYNCLTIDRYVIMPNHIHALISVAEQKDGRGPTLSQICQAFKSLATRKCRKNGYEGVHLFQRSFNDRIIRDDAHYQKTWYYIDINPQKWALDRYYNER